MSKKAREKTAEAGSASVSPYGSVLSYELVTSQPNRLINLIWPECRTWFIGPWGIIYFIPRQFFNGPNVFCFFPGNNAFFQPIDTKKYRYHIEELDFLSDFETPCGP